MKAPLDNHTLHSQGTLSTINPNDPNFNFELWAKEVKEQMVSALCKEKQQEIINSPKITV